MYWAAIDLLDHEEEPELYMLARFNLAHTFADLGDFIEARDFLVWGQEALAALGDEHLNIRRAGLYARVAAATGEPVEAEHDYLRVDSQRLFHKLIAEGFRPTGRPR